MGSKVEAPTRNYAQETADTLKAQVSLAPARYAADDKYSPLYALMNLHTMETTLKGTAGQRGLLDIYENDIAPSLAKQQQASVEGDISTVERYGTRATEALRSSDPQKYALIDALNKQAQGELDSGGDLDPAMVRQYQQATRAGQQARGLGYGQGDAFMEAMNVGQAAEARRRARQQFAGQVIGLDQTTSADPFMAILGRSAGNSAQVAGIGGQGNSLARQGASSLFNPESAYAGQLYGQNAEMKFDASKTNAANQNAMIGGAMKAVGGIAGGMM